jgi:hypothetical protein
LTTPSVPTANERVCKLVSAYGGNQKKGETMATKKATKKLRKAKALKHTKPLALALKGTTV